MKHIALISVLALGSGPALAQDGSVEKGFDLLSEGTRLLLRGLMEEMEPALKELQGTLQSMDQYHAPEILPNGDIIIRRKTPEEMAPKPDDTEEIEI